MSPQTVKLLMMFFLATALLNVTNYVFYLLCDPPSHRAMKTPAWNRRMVVKKHVTKKGLWTSYFLNTDDETVTSTLNDDKMGDIDGDYREQSSEASHFYEYVKTDLCPQKPPGLGPINIDEVVSLEAIEKLYDTLGPGGVYEEGECTARQSVAIIIPFKGQKAKLLKFLYTLHPFLMMQQLDYQIFVVEQHDSDNATMTPLNRGRVMNAAFSEAQRIQVMKKGIVWKCIIFHELDLLPVDSRNLYRCSKNPHQLVSFVNNRTFEHQYGGAIAVSPEQFTKVNGFSNLYSGNEAVYDDLHARLLNANYTVTRSTTFGKYSDIMKPANQTRSPTIQTASPLNLIDGLSTLTYKLDFIDAKQLYTLLSIDLDPSAKTNATENIWSKLMSQGTMTTESTLVSIISTQ